MDLPAAVAAAAAVTTKESYLGYNITLRLGTLLSLPSRFIARIRKIDDILNQDLEAHQHTLATTTQTFASINSRLQTASSANSSDLPYELVAMPGPLAFITSGYALGLVGMALLLNRIQHIVVPPRRTLAYRALRSRHSLLHALFYSIFPIDLSSTPYRFTLRIPSLYYLYKCLLLFSIILLQSAKLYPNSSMQWVQTLGQWARAKDMADVCWSTFGAVCLALVIAALTRGLEGADSTNTSPFNLFGYAMLLHIYSVPLTHIRRGPPSRPDTNVLITIILPLIQLTMIHTLGVKKSWSRWRLVPTTICSLATLCHFNYVLLTKPSAYPLLNYLPCLLETTMFIITLLTIGLNALTQLLLEGEIKRPLFGHSRSLAPKWDEDFAVVLLRLGTASLEATNVAGLGNEVGYITLVDVEKRRETKQLRDEGMVEIASAGVLSVSFSKKGARRARGFLNEIKHVKPHTQSESDMVIDHVWLNELFRFALTLLSVIRGFFKLFFWLVWFRWWQPKPAEKSNPTIGNQEPEGHSADDTYRRFLEGVSVSDDEDEYVPPNNIYNDNTSDSDSESINSDEGEVDGRIEELDETVGLYADISKSATHTPAPLLLAHMANAPGAPLTRRRYKRLVSGVRNSRDTADMLTSAEDWMSFVAERRQETEQKDSDVPEGRACVICTVEPREIICWPCRCLALCDDCRENLASRFSASKHSCPCCRRSVEGYSRIFIP